MTYRRWRITMFTPEFITAALVATAPAHAVRAAQFNISAGESIPAGCGSIEVSSDEYETAVGEETLTAGAGPVTVTPGLNGGVWIVGSTGQAFTVHACKFAAGRDRSDADSRVAAIQIENAAGHITGRGPSSDRPWTVFFIVETPRGGSVSAETTNGPITIRNVDATVVARAKNGPISIDESRGSLDARTVNGPISIAEAAGRVNVSAENGPLNVKLRGGEWDGEGLDGRTSNGPLTVSVPSGYASGVVVEADGRSPFTCRSCADAQRTWNEEGRRVQLGSGAERVRLRTTNGPVTVKN